VDIAGKGIQQFEFAYPKESIGRVSSFFGNFLVVVRAYAYIMTMGATGMKAVAENAVLNANYLRVKLAEKYHIPYNSLCMHEFVANDKTLEKTGATTMDVAKRLLEKGFHPMTVYFPLCVHAAMLIEPTETESKEELDKFVDAMLVIEAGTRLFPETHKNAPVYLPIRRVNETEANLPNNLNLRWKPAS
jgi:glycine dehydrogenase subunit 2